MPIDQAVLDHRVVGGVAADGEEGSGAENRRDRRRRPPRHDRSLARPAAQGGPAADRHRPLRLRHDPRARRHGVAPRRRERRGRGRAPSSTATSATRPTSRSRRAAPASSPESPRPAWRRSRRPRVDRGPDPRARPHVARPRRPRAQPVESISGDPATVVAARQALESGASALQDELRLTLDYYKAQEGAVPIDRVVLSGPGSAIPGLPERLEAARRPALPDRPPRGALRARRGRRRPPDPFLRPRPGELSDAPDQPDPRGPAARPRRAAQRRRRSPTS